MRPIPRKFHEESMGIFFSTGKGHVQYEEEVQLRVRVRNSVDGVVVRVRPESVDLTGHRGLVELPEEMWR